MRAYKRNITCKRLSSETAAYAAGLIDGEGYVGIARSKTNSAAKGCRRGISYRLFISVRMTDITPLKFLHKATGIGKLLIVKMPKNGKRQPYTWNIWSKQAASLLKEILPYLHVKTGQAKLSITFQNLMRSPGPAGLTDSEWDKRQELWRKIKSLNYGRGNNLDHVELK